MENDRSQTLEGGHRGRNKRAPERFRDDDEDDDESDPDEPRQYRESDVSDADDEEKEEEKNNEEDSVPSPRSVQKNTYATQQKLRTMLPSKFEVPPSAVRNIQYPISSLEELIRPIRTQSPIIHANFPSQWLPRAKETPRASAYVGGDTAPPIHMVSHTSSTGAASVHSTTSSITGAASTTPTNTTKHTLRQKDIHPVIKAAMLPYYSRVGRLQITRIMALADATWDDMPRLQKYVNKDANTLCYNYVLGKCNPKFCTHKSGHAAMADVTDDFANTICNLLQPGLDDMTEAMAKMSWGEFKAMVAARPDKRQRTE
jgi:hypothetical protein